MTYTITLREREYVINENISFDYDFFPFIQYLALKNKAFTNINEDNVADVNNITIIPVGLTQYIARLLKKMIKNIPLELVDASIDEGIYLSRQEYIEVYEKIAQMFKKKDPTYKDLEIDLDQPIEVKDETIEQKKQRLKAELAELDNN